MTIEAVMREMERRLSHAIEAAVEEAADGYRKRVTAQQAPPSSVPGEYPAEDTGQGAANISFGIASEPPEIAGRFGVMGENSPIPQFPGQDHVGGEHLDDLRENQQRLGMDTSFYEDLAEVRAAFRRGAKQ